MQYDNLASERFSVARRNIAAEKVFEAELPSKSVRMPRVNYLVRSNASNPKIILVQSVITDNLGVRIERQQLCNQFLYRHNCLLS